MQSRRRLDLFRYLHLSIGCCYRFCIHWRKRRRTVAFNVYAKLRAFVEEVAEIVIVQLSAQERVTMHCDLWLEEIR